MLPSTIGFRLPLWCHQTQSLEETHNWFLGIHISCSRTFLKITKCAAFSIHLRIGQHLTNICIYVYHEKSSDSTVNLNQRLRIKVQTSHKHTYKFWSLASHLLFLFLAYQKRPSKACTFCDIPLNINHSQADVFIPVKDGEVLCMALCFCFLGSLPSLQWV